MPHFADELHHRWAVRIVVRKFELCLEVAAFVEGVLRALEYNVPEEQIVIVFETDARAHIIILLAVCKLLCEKLHRVLF